MGKIAHGNDVAHLLKFGNTLKRSKGSKGLQEVLTHEDLSELIGLIYESAFETPQWERFLARMSQHFPGTGSFVFVHEGEHILPTYAQTGRFSKLLATSGFKVDFSNTQSMPALSATLRASNGFVASSARNVDAKSYVSSEFYQTMCIPYGYHHFLSIKLDSHNDRGAYINFVISSDPKIEAATLDPLFKVLKLLAPHAVRALQMSRSFTMARSALSVVGGFLDTLVLPMAVITAQREFVFANAAGRRLMARETPFRLTASGRLVMAQTEDEAVLAGKLRTMMQDPVASGMQIETETGPLSLCVTPFRPAREDVNPLDRDLLKEERLFAIFVGQQSDDAINDTLLQDTYELTAREAEVCRAVIAGRSPAQIASESNRSLKTVRNQIQAIHDKVGVETNAALMEALSVFRTVGAVFDGGTSEAS